jgi:hypothetical protein
VHEHSERQATTTLRARYERTCALGVDAQTRECIEYLENPAILIAEFTDSFLMAEAFDAREQDFRSAELPIAIRKRQTDDAVRRLVGAACLQVTGFEPYRFRYVARDIVPLWTAGSGYEGGDLADRRRFKGLDYVAITQEPDPVPILGVVVPGELPAPYLGLLRGLTCLAEVSTESQVARVNRYLFRGVLQCPTPFDLHVLVCKKDPKEASEAHPLEQLTRDLAEAFSSRLHEEWHLPNLLRHVLCLEMPQPRVEFDGTLRVLWHV